MTPTPRGIPPPRGKSCAACTKAKRRCDFALPACLRCSDRGIDCQYPQRTRSSLLRMVRTPAPSSPPANPPPHPSAQAQSPAPTFFSAAELMDDILSADVHVPEAFYSKDILSPFPAHDLQWPTPEAETIPGLASQIVRDASNIPMTRRGFEYARAMESQKRTPLMTPFNAHNVPDFVGERLRYGATYLERIPKALVETMGTPWCHPAVFKKDMPKSLKSESAQRNDYFISRRS